jgi:predicted dehydrogenase
MGADMFRLAVHGANESHWHAVASRLRGITIQPVGSSECDAALFFEDHGVEIERYLRAGKHVLVSVDARLSKGSMQTFASIAEASNVRFTIANPDRYLPSRQLIRQQLDAGKLGLPGMIRVHRWEPAPAQEAVLRDLDLVLWYFGNAPNRVYATQHVIHLGFPAGGMALLDHAPRMPAGDGYYYLSVIGSSGAAYADDHANMQLLFQGGHPSAVRIDEGVAQWSGLVQAFADSIVERNSNRVFPTWQQVWNVKDSVEESLKSKQAVAPKGTL